MADNCSLFEYEENNDDQSESRHFMDPGKIVYDEGDIDELRSLVHMVGRDPANLVHHLQRVYYCHKHQLAEQLFAALIDLLATMDGKGRGLAVRMVKGSKTVLPDKQRNLLISYLMHKVGVLPNSPYCIFYSGMVGMKELVQVGEATRREHDYLDLANDYIEYSQLDSAIDILEKGILEQPDRKDFQVLLLELYKSTRDEHKFRAMYESVLQNNIGMVDAWGQVDEFFRSQST